MFVVLFLSSFAITQIVDDDSTVFAYHMMAGFLMGIAVLFRIVWGFTGTPYSRFSHFALKPSDLFGYFKGIAQGGARFWDGHNPASSWAGLGMLAVSLGLCVTGLLMVSGQDKFLLVDIHEILAYSFLALALGHIGGIALHTVMHKDWIGLSMIHGKKPDRGPATYVGSSKTIVGVLFLAMMVALAVKLSTSFDPSLGQINLFGKTFQLLELEEEQEDD